MEKIVDTIDKDKKWGKFNPDIEIEIRDIRNGDWYWIQKSIVQDYGEKIKAGGIAIYNILATHVNSHNQKCYPGIRRMAKMLGSGPAAVIRKIKQLERLKLIKVDRQKGGKSTYTLLKIGVSIQKHLDEPAPKQKRGSAKTETLPAPKQKQNKNKEQELYNNRVSNIKKSEKYPFKITEKQKLKNREALDKIKDKLKEKGIMPK